jgi:phosphoglycolate phosphatase
MIRNVIFDWSGTLVDNLSSVYEATLAVFETLGGKKISLEEYRRENISPYMNFWNRYFPDLTKERQDLLFKEAIREARPAKPYPEVVDLLTRLHSKGIKIVVLSSQPQDQLESQAASFGIKNCIDRLVGSVHDKKGVIDSVLAKNRFSESDTVLVGDTVSDVETGKHAGLKTAAVTWGFDPADKLQKAKPDYIIDTLKELDKIIIGL